MPGSRAAGSTDGRIAGSSFSSVDFNRAGVPLMESVGAPDLRSAQDAVRLPQGGAPRLRASRVCDVKLEEGSLRCDANVSVRRPGEAMGPRVEVKNINSFRFVRMALDFEIRLQAALVERDEAFGQETRGWDAEKGETRSQRSKEAAMDYRYFPESGPPRRSSPGRGRSGAPGACRNCPRPGSSVSRPSTGFPPTKPGLLLQSPAFADFFEAAAGAGGRSRPPTGCWGK